MRSITLQRIYDSEQKQGYRILVDRLWPRGVQKEAARVDLWLKEVGPTSELRKWFGHDPSRFDEFRDRYMKELKENQSAKDAYATLVEMAEEKDIVLLYGAKDEEHNQAVILFDMLKRTYNG